MHRHCQLSDRNRQQACSSSAEQDSIPSSIILSIRSNVPYIRAGSHRHSDIDSKHSMKKEPIEAIQVNTIHGLNTLLHVQTVQLLSNRRLTKF